MPSSVREGVRPSAARMRSYSSAVMPCWARSSGVTATGGGATLDAEFMAFESLLSHVCGVLCLPCFANRPDVHRSRAAASTHRLSAGAEPGRGKCAIVGGVGFSCPTAVSRIPYFARVGVDQDRFTSGGSPRGNQPGNKPRMGAVDTYNKDQGRIFQQRRTISKPLPMNYMLSNAAGER